MSTVNQQTCINKIRKKMHLQAWEQMFIKKTSLEIWTFMLIHLLPLRLGERDLFCRWKTKQIQRREIITLIIGITKSLRENTEPFAETVVIALTFFADVTVEFLNPENVNSLIV
ncbi:hypothetical protein CDAR_245011 [Caerostris darwini]|uniref:Uncharacterized protein n=1 Tax=Caerostris darwini TaxID=1538125 RepID=A0AAV4V7B6_9ARAC|nr:hypothetical protein CDAR_245011 [Caerostris darwini]